MQLAPEAFPMKIQVTTNFSYPLPPSRDVAMLPTVNTVEKVLRQIGREIDSAFLDAGTSDLRRDIKPLVNGKEIWFHAGELKRRLEEGESNH